MEQEKRYYVFFVVNAVAVFVTVAIHFVVAVTTLDFVVPLVVVSTIRRA